MKKIFLAIVFLGVCVLFSVTASAQREASSDAKVLDGTTALFDAKNFVNGEGFGNSGVPVDITNIGAKVQKTFSKNFGARDAVRWSQLAKNIYLAQFDLDGRKTNAVFANNGFMVYAVTYGVAKDAPKEVRSLLRSFYPEHEMGATFQVRYRGATYNNAWADQVAWIVNLESEDNIVIARVVDGAVDELGKLEKKMETKKVRKGKVIIPKQ